MPPIPAMFGRPVRLAAADGAAGPVWAQIAYEGRFDGYPGGAEFTRAMFEQIVANFRRSPAYAAVGGVGAEPVIPYDYEHASEQDATMGSIPQSGAPAPGWVIELEVRSGTDGKAQLWALTQWGARAKEQIKAGEYRWTSVCVWDDAIDPDTGKAIGPLLTSVALTNHPFLRGMAPLAARRRSALDSGHTPGTPENDPMPASELTAKLAAILKVNPHDELVLAAAEKSVKAAADSTTALDQLMELFGSSDFQGLVAKASELIRKAAEAEQVIAALNAANERLAGVDSAEAEAETDAVVASMRLPEDAARKVRPIILSSRKAAIGDKAKLDAFRKAYPLPEQDRALLTQRVFAGPLGAQYAPEPLPMQARAGTGDGDRRQKVRGMPGRNDVERAIAHLGKEEPGFRELDRAVQAFRAGRWLHGE